MATNRINGNAVRVEIEFEDGTIHRLVGPPAEEYMSTLAAASFSVINHGGSFKPLPWETVKPACQGEHKPNV